MSERDQFLTEAMGECWHDWKMTCYKEIEPDTKFYCLKCRISTSRKFKAISFSTWAGFGKIWEWAIQQEWFEYVCRSVQYNVEQPWVITFIHPDRFANAVYNFLKDKNNGSYR